MGLFNRRPVSGRFRCGARPRVESHGRVESRLGLESLEGRIVLAAGISFDAKQGVLSLLGTERNDVATISIQGTMVVADLRTPSVTYRKLFTAAAVKTITDWVEQHSNWNESLLIVTADHGHYLVLEKPELLIVPKQ